MEIETREIESEYKPVVDEKGFVKLKKKSKISEGKKSKAAGGRFELKIRKDLEDKGWIVTKWANNLEPDVKNGKGWVMIPAKRKFNPFSKALTIGTGFPDFVAFQKMSGDNDGSENEKIYHKVIGVEVKMNGTLSKIEKQKCKFLLDNKIFSEILIAKRGIKDGRKELVEYDDFKERYKKLFV
ncbi:MAG: hypothetical protein WCP89_04720 [archaeon]